MPDDPDDRSADSSPGEAEPPSDLEDFHERYRELAEQNLVGIGLVREDGFVRANPRLAEILGYEPDEFPEVDPVELIPEGRRDELAADAAALLEGDLDEATYSGPIRRKDGSLAHVEVFLRRARYRGEGAFLSVTVEVTDRVRQAAALEVERERLDFLNAMLRHHVLNGMNVVLATAARLAEDAEGERLERLETIERRGSAIVDRVGTIRSLVRTIQRDAAAEFRPVELASTIRRAVDAADEAYDGATVRVGEVDPDLEVAADGMLVAVFEDLIENAVVHHDRPDPAVVVWAEPGEGVATVHVEDDGPGVPEAVREDVFDDEVVASGRSGFGLHVVHLLVSLYGGTLEIEDREPRGTVVSVTLPLADD